MNIKGYEKLAEVLHQAYEQAAVGKGDERHSTGQPFHEQPMQTISKLVGSGDGMAFQAIKKIQESIRLNSDRAQIHELLGAINYIAGIVIFLQEGVGYEEGADMSDHHNWQEGDIAKVHSLHADHLQQYNGSELAIRKNYRDGSVLCSFSDHSSFKFSVENLTWLRRPK